MNVSRITIAAILIGYISLAAVVAAPQVINMQKPTYLDLTIVSGEYVVNSIAWTPDIDTKTFAAGLVNLTNSGVERTMSLSIVFWNSEDIQIASGSHSTTVAAGSTSVYEVPLSWVGDYTTDNISSGRIMVV